MLYRRDRPVLRTSAPGLQLDEIDLRPASRSCSSCIVSTALRAPTIDSNDGSSVHQYTNAVRQYSTPRGSVKGHQTSSSYCCSCHNCCWTVLRHVFSTSSIRSRSRRQSVLEE